MLCIAAAPGAASLICFMGKDSTGCSSRSLKSVLVYVDNQSQLLLAFALCAMANCSSNNSIQIGAIG